MIICKLQKELWSTSGKMNLEVDLEISSGKLVTIYGKSGAGKTTILRMLAGLSTADQGTIEVDNSCWFDSASGVNLEPQARQIGFISQEYALFPNMTVEGNLSFALMKNQDKKGVEDLIEMMELGDLRNRKPSNLSGGQKQRVAIARALVQKPRLLLMDEPFSALDRAIRSRLQQHVLAVHKEFGLTTIHVSHESSEILKMADEVLVLEGGRIIKKGNPEEIFGHNHSAGFSCTGEVVRIEDSASGRMLVVLTGTDLIRIQDWDQELFVGDRIVMTSDKFNPEIRKLE